MDPLRPDTPERLAEALRGIASDHIAIRLGGNFSKDRVGGAVTDAVSLMKDKAVRRLPVVENGRPVGIVSLGDLAVERDRHSALGEISAAPANH